MAKKGSFLKKTIRIISFVKPHWKLFTFVLVLSLIISLVALINPYLQKYLFDEVLIGKKYTLLFALAGVFLGVYLFSRAFSAYIAYKSATLTQKMIFNVKLKLFNHLQRLDLGFFYNKKVGDMLSRLDDDVASIYGFISTIFDTALISTLTGISILVVSFSLSWKATTFALLFFPFYLLASYMYTKKMTKQYKKVKIKSADMMSFLQERLSSIRAIKAFTREDAEEKKFKHKGEELISLNLKNMMLSMKAGFLSGFIIYLPSFVILFYGGYQVMAGLITIGTLIALRSYIQQLFGPIQSIGGLHRSLKMQMVSVDRVFEFLDIQPKIKEKPGAVSLKNIEGNIEFNNISFGYERKKTVLKGISFDLKPNETVGLVGPSGSGKSTIANLLMRFYDVTKGSIMLDGKDLRDVKIESLRRNIGIVSQDF